MHNLWLLKSCKYDLSSLCDTGEICTVFDSRVSPLDLSTQRRIIIEDVFRVASPKDFIICVGPNVMLINFTTCWLQHFKSLNLLVYDNNSKKFAKKFVKI